MRTPKERCESPVSTQDGKAVCPDDSSSQVSAQRLVYFAAERTLLSWIRVALGLMALGFVVDRFELVLQLLIRDSRAPFHASGSFAWIGATLVGLGVAACIAASVRYARFHILYFRHRTTDPGRGLLWVIAVAIAVAFVGTAIVIALAVTGV